MMKAQLALVTLAAFALAACDAPQQPQPDPTATGGVDVTVDDCPRADGQPCR